VAGADRREGGIGLVSSGNELRPAAAGRGGLVGGLVQLLLAAPLFVAVVFDALGELLQRLVFLAGAELAVGADAEGKGVSFFLDGVGGMQQEVAAFAVLVVAGEGGGQRDGEADGDERNVLPGESFRVSRAAMVVGAADPIMMRFCSVLWMNRYLRLSVRCCSMTPATSSR
jgi:hypothetical protein